MRLIAAIFFSVACVGVARAASVQNLTPPTTVNNVWAWTDLPLVDGTDCIWVVQPTNDDRKLCTNYAHALGGIPAAANTIMMNPLSGLSLDDPKPLPNCPDSFGQFVGWTSGSGWTCNSGTPPNAVVYGTPPNASAVTSSTPVMLGLARNLIGQAIIIKPRVTGVVEIDLMGAQFNETVAGGQITYQIRIGTGTPPAFGDPLTGTLVGSVKPLKVGATNKRYSIAASGVASGLVHDGSTAYWVDVAAAETSGGTALFGALSMLAVEQ